MVPPLITLEEHWLPPSTIAAFKDAFEEQFAAIPGVKDKLQDVGSLRLNEMAKGKVSMQVISHACAPGGLNPEQCREANDLLAAAVRKRSDAFAGFTFLPVGFPAECAKELKRSIKELGFVGALVDNHVDGKYFDGPEYDALWHEAVELDVPIYLHPTWPAESSVSQYTGNFTSGATRSLGSSGWGWHADTGLHILRLFAAGVFDRFPELKIIIGHFGEMLPYQLTRICNLSARWGDRQRKLKQVWDENLWFTTSGVWSLDPLRCMLGNTKIERILYSVDYPFEKNENGLKWIEELEQSGLVTQEELEMIAYKNAEKLLGIKAPQGQA